MCQVCYEKREREAEKRRQQPFSEDFSDRKPLIFGINSGDEYKSFFIEDTEEESEIDINGVKYTITRSDDQGDESSDETEEDDGWGDGQSSDDNQEDENQDDNQQQSPSPPSPSGAYPPLSSLSCSGGPPNISIDHSRLRKPQPDDEEVEIIPTKISEVPVVDRAFARTIKSLLTDSARARKKISKRGRIKTSRLANYKTSPLLFVDKQKSEIGYRVTFLVDCSGSMSNKFELANEILSGLCLSMEYAGVETQIIQFNYHINVYKQFSDKFDVDKHDLPCDVHFGNNDGNNDFDAICYTLNHIKDNKKQGFKDIFVMISDGRPAPSSRTIKIIDTSMEDYSKYGVLKNDEAFCGYIADKAYHDDDDYYEVVFHQSLFKRYPSINCFGLGMYEGGWQVPNYKTVNDLSQSKKEIVNFLKTSIKKGVA